MDNPFWQNINDIFARLKGRNLIIASVIWVLLFILAISCTLGWVPFSGKDETPDPAATATSPPSNASAQDAPQPTQAGGFTLPTPTPKPGEPTAVAPLPSNLEPLPWGDFGYGIAAHAIGGLPDYTLDQVAKQLKLPWFKQQVRWDHFSTAPGQMDWSGYDVVVEFAAERNLKVLMSIVGAPQWSRTYLDDNPEAAPPDDLSQFAAFLGELVDRYKGKIHAIEVWNEQNLDREWDTEAGVNAADYVTLLKLAHQIIKARDPNIIVISGALSPVGASATDPANASRVIYMDDFQYFQAMVDAGFLQYADCVGAHHNGINMPPDVAWDEGYNDPTAQFRGPFDNPDHSWSFKSTLWGYHEMVKQAGYSTPLCLTEFGWATAEGFGGHPEGFEFALDNTLEEQAAWDVQAFQLMREWGFVRLAFLWNLDYSYKGGQGAVDPNAPYSILDLNGAARPAYDAIANMPKIP